MCRYILTMHHSFNVASFAHAYERTREFPCCVRTLDFEIDQRRTSIKCVDNVSVFFVQIHSKGAPRAGSLLPSMPHR